MNQVGDTIVFTAPGTMPGSALPIYVWKFWDASVGVSVANRGTIAKRLNVGGNPIETSLVQPYALPYRVDIVDQYGTTAQVLNRNVAVNNPPSLYGNPTVTPNNQLLPYQTAVRLQAFDVEGKAVSFYWYEGAAPIGGKDVTSGPVNVAGTYAGTLFGASVGCYTNVLTTTVTDTDTTLTCKVVDADSGTTLVHVPVQGYDPDSPLASVAATPDGLTADASTLPDVIIAPGQVVNFTTYAYDPTPGEIRFTYYLFGTNGWNQLGLPIIANGVTTPMSRGYKNDYAVAVSGETVTGLRTVEVKALNLSTQRYVDTEITVNLVENSAPEIVGVGCYQATSDTELTSIARQVLPARTIVRFKGTAADANDDALYFRWNLTTPTVPSTSYSLFGHECYVDVSDWPVGAHTALGSVVVYDKYGRASVASSIPQLTILS